MSNVLYGTSKKSHGKLNPNWEFEPKLLNHLKSLTAVPQTNFIYCDQVHGSQVEYIQTLPAKLPVPSSDGLITNNPNILLLIKHADCIPVFLYDQTKGVIAIVHSGWKGTVQKIGLVALNKMIKQFNCQIKDIHVHIGPCAHKCCYTLENIDEFKKDFEWSEYTQYSIQNTEYSIDLPGFITNMFIKAGVLTTNLANEDICTICNDNYHSWRYNKKHNKKLELGVSYICLKS